MTKVSIVIRTKNEEKWLPYCLEMISKQTFKDFEVILVDNKSEDRTKIIAKEFNIKKIVNINNFLPGKAINLGVKKAKGEYIVCLSSHCVPTNNKWLLNLLKNFKNKKNKFAAVYGRQLPLRFSSPADKRDLLITFGLDKKIQKKDYFFHNANSIIPAKILKIYPFDNKVKNLEDRIWGKKIIEAGFNIIYEPSAAVYHHHGIHHNNSHERSEGVVKIINNIDKRDLENIPNLLLPENNINYVVVPIDNFKENIKFKKELINNLLLQLIKSKYVNKIFLIAKNHNFLDNKKIIHIPRFKTKINNNDSIDIIMSKSFKIIQSKYKYPNSLMFVNYDYINRPEKLFDKIIENFYMNDNDSLFPCLLDFGIYWYKNDKNEYSPTEELLKNRNQRSPLYKALYGLGCITTPKNIVNKRLIGGKVSIMPINNILNSFRVKDLPTKKLKQFKITI